VLQEFVENDTIVVRCKKKSFFSTSFSSDSSLQFWRNLRALDDAQSSSASIPLYLRNSFLLNNHFLNTLSSSSYSSNSFHLLSYSPHVSSTFNFAPITPSDSLYNIFKYIRLTSASRSLRSHVPTVPSSMSFLILFSIC